MKRNLYILLAAIVLIGFLAMAGCSGGDSTTANSSNNTSTSSTLSGDYVANELVVRLKENAKAEDVASAVGGYVEETFTIGKMEYARIKLPQDVTLSEGEKILNGTDLVDYAEPNYIYKALLVPNDPEYTSRQYCHKLMNTEKAWDVTTGSSSVTVAVVDTGVDGTHPEFSGKMVAGYDYINNKALTGNENSDDHGHGTHVAGIACAIGNNNRGVAGMNWKAKIMPVKVLNSAGLGTNSTIAQGITYAAQNGADVINLSLGGSFYSQAIRDAIEEARARDVGVVAASGNTYTRSLTYPASYPGVIAVGSTNGQDEVSVFSTRSPYLSVSAPGSDIYSTVPGGEYATFSGTSMAAPQVSGLYALVKGLHPAWIPSHIRSQIEQTADDKGDAGFDEEYGYGRINAQKAVGTAVADQYGTALIAVLQGITPVSGVNVVIKDATGKAVATGITSSGGVSSYYDLKPGSYTATARYNGVTRSAAFNVTAGGITNVPIIF